MMVAPCATAALGWLLTVGAATASVPTPTAVLADGGKAYKNHAAATPLDNNDWTGSTFMIGVCAALSPFPSVSDTHMTGPRGAQG